MHMLTQRYGNLDNIRIKLRVSSSNQKSKSDVQIMLLAKFDFFIPKHKYITKMQKQ